MELYEYQQRGVEFLLSEPRRLLADMMGLGKTPQACVALRELWPRRTLVVTAASTIENWHRELKQWGAPRAEVVSYERLVRRPDYGRGAWDVVILDEAHYCKTRTAQRTRAALDVARKAKRAWLLTATPMPNHPGELYPMIAVLWPEVLKELGIRNYLGWLNKFCHWSNTPYGIKVWSAKRYGAQQLVPHLKRIMLRRKIGDVPLPPLRVDVSLLPQNGSLLRALREAGIDVGALTRGMLYEESSEHGSLSRLRRLLGTYKAPRVGDILDEELREQQYDKIVVMAYHHDTLDFLCQRLRAHGVVGFDGRTPLADRQRAIDEFNEGDAKVFLAQQTAAGVGINLQVANEIVLVEPSWSPEENAQAIKRCHRIGTTLPVRARIFAVAGSVDEAVMEVAARKTRMQLELGL